MSDCLFCRIINGEIPGDVVYRDGEVMAFKDVNPQAPVHILVIPVKHIDSIMEPEASEGKLLARIYSKIQSLAKEFGLEKGFRVVTNFGHEGGQTVYHLHFHILGKRTMGWPPG